MMVEAGALLLLLCLSSIGTVTAGDEPLCFKTSLTAVPELLEIGTPNFTCYTFLLSGYDAVYINIIATTVLNSNVSRITVDNLNGTQKYPVSDRNFTEGAALLPYVVVGRGSDGNVTEDIVGITVYFDSPYTTNASVTVGTITNTTCSVNLSTIPDVITPPDYQVGLPINFTCRYDITPSDTNDGKADLHLADTLEFTEFSFSEEGRLMIGPPDDLEKYYGNELPPDYVVNGKFAIWMTINAAKSDTFSAALVRSTKECTKQLTLTSAASTISIKSLNYPVENYPNNLNCKIIVRSGIPNSRVQLALVDIELASDSDNLVVIDGGASRNLNSRIIAYVSEMDSYRHKDAVMVSSGEVLMLKFRTDEVGTAKGFALTASLTDVNTLTIAPSTLSFAPTISQSRNANLAVLGEIDLQIELTPNLQGGVKMSPGSSVMCYDGDSVESPLITTYRTNLKMFPAYSTGRRMLCVASGFTLNNDFFNASTQIVSQALNKFSLTKSDVYTLDVTLGEAGQGNSTYNWIIQPDQFNGSKVIELTVTQLEFPVDPSSVTIQVQSLKGKQFANLTADTVLPYRLRASAASGLRLSTSVKNTGDMLIRSELSLSASYKIDDSSIDVKEGSGAVMSPYYPQDSPQNTVATWRFSVPPMKSLQLSFSPLFELTDGSLLCIQHSGTNETYLKATGPTVEAPNDLIINNTDVNSSLAVGIFLETTMSSKVKVAYTHLDGGYSSTLGKIRQKLQSPGYPSKLDSAYSASWVISVPRNNSNGTLLLVKASVTFTATNDSSLELRDGPSADSPLLYGGKALKQKLGDDSYTATTSSNYIYVSYKFEQEDVNATGSPFLVYLLADECSKTLQCSLPSNKTVCMPPAWRCDGFYHCLDGKDELGCTPTPTVPGPPAPAVTKEGAAWWVVGLCILAGAVFGVVLSVIIITRIMRRRGRGYDRLSELMTPVPT